MQCIFPRYFRSPDSLVISAMFIQLSIFGDLHLTPRFTMRTHARTHCFSSNPSRTWIIRVPLRYRWLPHRRKRDRTRRRKRRTFSRSAFSRVPTSSSTTSSPPLRQDTHPNLVIAHRSAMWSSRRSRTRSIMKLLMTARARTRYWKRWHLLKFIFFFVHRDGRNFFLQ